MKRKYIILLFGLVLFLMVPAYFFNKDKQCEKQLLAENPIEIEYGDKVDFNTIGLNDSCQYADSQLDESMLVFNQNQDYPAVGTYDLQLNYTKPFLNIKSNLKINVIVKDTKAPVFTKTVDEVEMVVGDALPLFEAYFEVEDLSDVDLTFDLGKTDSQDAGDYSLKAIAKDAHGNVSEYPFVLVVNDKEGLSGQEPLKITKKDGYIIVNKKHPLPKNYNPGEDVVAGLAIKELIADMQAAGLDVSSEYGGFRDYAFQKVLYDAYVIKDGKKMADTYSARPGFSEHQTGLTFDLRHPNRDLVDKPDEAAWIKENAHLYGFIVRYPLGKEEITGYQHEPWHLRYIGDEAETIYQSGLTLEEYLNVLGGDYYD